MYIKRHLEERLIRLLAHFPAVAVLGPRQVGKTTLVKEIRKRLPRESVYFDLENPNDEGAFNHPVELLSSVVDKTVIIDEIQRKPELFRVLRSVIDENRFAGRFILLGSASEELLFLSNETLAGRIVYLELTPFQYSEIEQIHDFRQHWLRGGFPEPFIIEDSEIRTEWFKSFVFTYLERDLRSLGLSSSVVNLSRLFQMLAAMQGGLLNYSALANSLGVSSPTLKTAISYFERSFMIRLLRPWYANVGKRLVKTPKMYIRDSGIVHYISNIKTYEELQRYPSLGNLWEGYVIEEIINGLGDDFQYHFYRTSDGAECDLLVCKGDQCIAAIDAKYRTAPKTTRSMKIVKKDLNPHHLFYVVPDCKIPYQISENETVATPAQLLWKLKE